MDAQLTRDCLNFLNESPGCYHAAAAIAARLEAAGHTPLREEEPWNLTPGMRYVIIREGSVLAFRVPWGKGLLRPKGDFRGFRVAAAHTDSPALQLRQEPELSSPGGTVRLAVEPYGGGLWRTWQDRPLTVSGRAVVRDGRGRLATRLVYVDRDLLVIPSLAIHMDRTANKGVELKPQTDLLPLFALSGLEDGADGASSVGTAGGGASGGVSSAVGTAGGVASAVGTAGGGASAVGTADGSTTGGGAGGGSGNQRRTAFRRLIADTLDVSPEDVVSTDLFLVPRAKAALTGLHGEFLSGPRLDNLLCAYACLRGYLASEDSEAMPVLAVFNCEEVGSGTWQGAGSAFLRDVLERICDALNVDFHLALAQSFLLSADNAHAIHPAHPEYADSVDVPVLGGGVVLKYSAYRRYTTEAVSAAVFQEICRLAGVPLQRYSNRADLPGGSTLGHLAAAQVPMRSVDVGIPQLSMHSAYETAAAVDVGHMADAVAAYCSRELRFTSAGVEVA